MVVHITHRTETLMSRFFNILLFQIHDEKVEFRVGSRIGSLANVKVKPSDGSTAAFCFTKVLILLFKEFYSSTAPEEERRRSLTTRNI